MHILLLSPVKESFARRYVTMVLEAGHRVTFMGSESLIENHNSNYRFIRYPWKLLVPSKFASINSIVRKINSIFQVLGRYQLKRIWQKYKPDLVHVHWIDGRANDCAKAGLHPLILSAWGSDINDLFIPGMVNSNDKKKIVESLNFADHITADSKDILEKCKSLTNGQSKTSLLYYGVDFNLFKPGYETEALQLRHDLGISADEKIILSIRSLKPFYCHHDIVTAFAQLIKNNKTGKLRLILKRYFSRDEYEAKLLKQIEKLRITDHVVWIDPLPDEKMPILYTIADVVVNYPEKDAFPVSFLEAAACKRPVVSSLLPAYEGVFPPDSFWMVPPKNPSELSKILGDVLTSDLNKIECRLEKAFDIAWQIGEWHQCVKVIDDLYNKVVANN